MKALIVWLSVSCLSCCLMVLIDHRIGPKAEFLNAYSVAQRLGGKRPSVEDSLVAKKLGSTGELLVVLLVNLAIGAVITGLAWLLLRPR